MTEELVTVYDADGNVIGAQPRSRVYAEGLWHASAGVLVRSLDGTRIYVHRRTMTKAVFAGMHDCLAGGVVDPGETPLQAATRELAEELGISGPPLTALASAAWDGYWAGKPMRCHLFAYEARWDGPIRHQPGRDRRRLVVDRRGAGNAPGRPGLAVRPRYESSDPAAAALTSTPLR